MNKDMKETGLDWKDAKSVVPGTAPSGGLSSPNFPGETEELSL